MIGYLNLRFRREYKLGYCLGYFKFDTNNKRDRQQNFISDSSFRYVEFVLMGMKLLILNIRTTDCIACDQNFFILFKTISTFLHPED